MTAVFSLCWHYLLCAGLLALCWKARENGRRKVMAWITAAMLITSVAGFLLVYAGPFAESGKTFAMYATKYALYSFPIFLFPLTGLVWTVRSEKKCN